MEGYNLLGIVYSSQKDYANALEAFQHALKIDPNSTKTHNNLGNLYVAQERLDLAEKEFRKVLRLDPANRDGNYNLGLVLMARNSAGRSHRQLSARTPCDYRDPLQSGSRLSSGGTNRRRFEGSPESFRSEGKSDVQLHFTLGVLLAAAKQYDVARR